MPLLGDLRLLQRLVAAREVGAGVLPVAIEEQAVEPPVQVVVVRHVAPRAMRRVVLVDAAPRSRRGPLRSAGDGMALGVRHHVQRQHVDDVVDAASVRHQPAVHVGLAHRQRRVEHQPADRPCIARWRCRPPARNRPARRSWFAVRRASAPSAGRRDKSPQDGVKGPPHRSLPFSRTEKLQWRKSGRVRQNCSWCQFTARKITEALVPPKPKLLDSAQSILRSCAVLATRSITLSRLGCVQIQRRRRHAVAHREDREHRLDRAGRAEQMPGRRLGGRHRQPPSPRRRTPVPPPPAPDRRPAASRCRARSRTGSGPASIRPLRSAARMERTAPSWPSAGAVMWKASPDMP